MADIWRREAFHLSWPAGFTEQEGCNLQPLQACGLLRQGRDPDGRVTLTFSAPFEDLTLVDGEQLTVLKASRVERALAYWTTK